MSTEKTKTPGKAGVVFTYILVLACLILGWVLPMYDGDKMLITYFASIFNGAIGSAVIPVEGFFANAYSAPTVPLFGAEVAIFNWALLVYAVMTVIGVIALIPVLFGKKACKGFAGFVEYFAILAFTVYSFYYLCATDTLAFENFNLNLFIAIVGTFAAVILQGWITKKGSGVIKFFIFLISSIALLMLLDVATLIPALEFLGTSSGGAEMVIIFMADPGAILSSLSGEFLNVLFAYAALILFVGAVINWLCDCLSLVTVSNKGGKVLSLIRYLLTTLAGVIAIVLTFVNGGSPLIVEYVLVATQLILFIIACIRVKKHKKIKQAAMQAEADDEEDEELPVEEAVVEEAVAEETETVVEQDPSTQVIVPILVPTPAPAEPTTVQTTNEQVVQNRTVVYNVQNVYNGPTDVFMNSLTDEEKIEFHSTFILKQKGNFSFLPDYEIGGNNQDFFAAIFIYLGKFRNVLSTNLLNKIYIHLNLLR